MAVTVERLIATLEAKIDKYEKNLAKAYGQTDRQFSRIERRGRQLESRLSSVGAGASAAFARAFAVVGGVRGAQQLIDAATRIENSLKVAGLAGDELTAVYDRLLASAQRNAAPIESLVELYGRAALVQKELGITSEELLGFTDKIAVALRVSGKSAAESSGALLQLSQALGSGVVRAEEFNSILEGALPIAQAAAAGLKEAGGSVATLRQLVVDGKVSSEAFFRAFEAGAPILEEKVAGAVFTIGQRLTNLQTALIDAAGRFNNSTQAANTFGEAIDNVSDFVNSIDFDGLISEIDRIIGQFQAGIQWANNFAAAIAEASGLEGVGSLITGGKVSVEPIPGLKITSQKALRERINQAFASGAYDPNALVEEQLRRLYGGAAPKGGRIGSGKPGFTPVSLQNFAPPGGSGGGGGKKGRGSRESAYERETRKIQERTEAIRAETEAQAGINPLIEDYGFAVEKAAAKQELLQAAKKEGLKITPELEAEIDALATAYATASVEAEKLKESQDAVRQAAEEFRDFGKDVLGGFISDLRAGKSGAEALANALNKIGDKLLEIALNNLFSGFGAGGGGFFGSIIKLFTGGASAASAMASPTAAPATSSAMSAIQPMQMPSVLRNGSIASPRGAGRNETINVVLTDDSGRMASIADDRIQTAAGPIIRVSVQQSTKAVRQQMPSMISEAQARSL